MLTLKFPSHAANILGGNGDDGRHGLLKGERPGGIGEMLWRCKCDFVSEVNRGRGDEGIGLGR
jgi:hypothetical protein